DEAVEAGGYLFGRRALRRRVRLVCGLVGRLSQPAWNAEAVTLALSLVALFDALEEACFVLAAIVLADRDAVELQRAADEIAVANVPGVLALLAPQRQVSGAPD